MNPRYLLFFLSLTLTIGFSLFFQIVPFPIWNEQQNTRTKYEKGILPVYEKTCYSFTNSEKRPPNWDKQQRKSRSNRGSVNTRQDGQWRQSEWSSREPGPRGGAARGKKTDIHGIQKRKYSKRNWPPAECHKSKGHSARPGRHAPQLNRSEPRQSPSKYTKYSIQSETRCLAVSNRIWG